MSELLRRAQNVTRIANDVSLPAHERLQQALQAFSGLQITGLAPAVWEPLEAAFVSINHLFDGFDSENDDLQQLDEEDLQQGLDVLYSTASRTIEFELDRIVAELAQADRKLPVATIREVREHRDLMVPRLIRVLREATVAARNGHPPDDNAHFFALFLLSELQAAESFPAIVEAISLPGDLPFDLFGDAVIETLSRIFAQFAGDSPEYLDTLIADRNLNSDVRWEAAVTYVHLVRNGSLSRDSAVQRMQQHLRQAIDQRDTAMASALVIELAGLAPKEAIEDISRAYEQGLIEPYMIRKEEVEQSIAKGDAAVQETLALCRPTGIIDTIEELQKWAAFREEPAKSPVKSAAPRLPAYPMPMNDAQLMALAAADRAGPRRNDPCPCGSGKKFKKCCGFPG